MYNNNSVSDFSKNVERLIDPIEVGAIHFVHGINKLLPVKLQNKLSDIANKQSPIIGFVIEPYSSFLCYEIKNLDLASKSLPKNFRLIKTKIFESDIEEKYYAIFSSVRAHTSVFWGSRMEFNVIAENIDTGLLSWIIVDYDTDTIRQDKKQGLRDPNASKLVNTIDFNGNIIVDISNTDENRYLSYNTNITNGNMKKLSERLWLEGNLSNAYGRELVGEYSEPFGLIFDPKNVEYALDMPIEKVEILQNNWFVDMLKPIPSAILVFPYAQHFLVDISGIPIKIKNKDQLRQAMETFDFQSIRTVSASGVKYLILGLILLLTIFLLLSLLF